MCKVVMRCCFAVCVVGLVATNVEAQQSPLVYMEIVGHNAECVGGGNDGAPCARDCDCPGGACSGAPVDPYSVQGVAGDEFIIEMYATEWSPSGDPERMRAWKAEFGSDSLRSGTRGELELLEGYRCCQDRQGFPYGSPDCSDVGGTCVTAGFCIIPIPQPKAAGAFISMWRLDYPFLLRAGFQTVDFSASDVTRFQGALQNTNDAVPFVTGSPPGYLATLVLKASADACGTFTVAPTRADGDTAMTMLQDRLGTGIVDPLTGVLGIEGVTINLGDCECSDIVGSVPADCSIDARQPGDPDGVVDQGTNSVRVTLNCERRPTGLAALPGNFILTEEEADGSPPVVASATHITGTSDVVVTATQPFAEGKWTCIQFDAPGVTPPGGKWCFGVLPGDVDSSRIAEIDDVTAMVGCLNTGTCTEVQCDVDRSGSCLPPDILRVIDLLTGGAAYSPGYLDMAIETAGQELIACPAASAGD